MSLQESFSGFLATQGSPGDGKRFLLAVSGGIDSTVMTHLFSLSRFEFAIAHCNFQLRGEESDQDEDLVKTLALSLGVGYFVKRFDTSRYAREHGLSVQMAARKLRYDWFTSLLGEHGFDVVATAHHRDDEAETFFINLIRGTGIAGLHGIPAINRNIVRPLIFASREEIMQYAREHAIQYREDHSNSSLKYLRNRIRLELIPLLTELNPSFSEGLHRTIRQVSEMEQLGLEVLSEWREKCCTSGSEGMTIHGRTLTSFSKPELLLWHLCAPFGIRGNQIEQIIRALDAPGTKKLSLQGYHFWVNREEIRIIPDHPGDPDEKFQIEKIDQEMSVERPVVLKMSKRMITRPFHIPDDPDIASLDFDTLTFPLTIRKPKPGDSFRPLGMRGKKKVSDFFIDLKVPRCTRERSWLLCSGDRIVWVIGYRIGHQFRITEKTKHILQIFLSNFVHS